MIYPTTDFRQVSVQQKRAGDSIRAIDWNRIQESVRKVTNPPHAPFVERRYYNLLDFSWVMLSEDSVRFRAGYFTIHGYLDYRVPQTDISLTGTPEYIYLQYEFGAAVATIEHSSSLPVTNSTYYRHRFMKFTATSGVYFPSEMYFEGGSVNQSSPLRGAT